MQKSKAERERLLINARTQQVLMGRFVTEPEKTGSIPPLPKSERGIASKVARKPEKQADRASQPNDVYQPVGEIDYSRFNKAKK